MPQRVRRRRLPPQWERQPWAHLPSRLPPPERRLLPQGCGDGDSRRNGNGATFADRVAISAATDAGTATSGTMGTATADASATATSAVRETIYAATGAAMATSAATRTTTSAGRRGVRRIDELEDGPL